MAEGLKNIFFGGKKPTQQNKTDQLIAEINGQDSEKTNLEILQLIFPDNDWTNPDINSQGEVQVVSPFPRSYDKNGNAIFENHPSASVNIEKGLFYDFALTEEFALSIGSNGCTLQELFKLVYDIPRQSDANRMLDYLLEIDSDRITNWQDFVFKSKQNTKLIEKWKTEYYLTDEVINDMQLGWKGYEGELWTVPVFAFNKLVDLVTYTPIITNPTQSKVMRLPKSRSGMIVGHKLWERDCKRGLPTIICAGEKDTLVVRSLGFNAICFTGGEGIIPKMWGNLFANKTVYIAYDNDDAGRKGAIKLGIWLKKQKATVFNITAHHFDEHLKNIKGGDMFDMVQKYSGYGADLSIPIQWLNLAMRNATEIDNNLVRQEKLKEVPLISLNVAQNTEHLGRLRQSQVQVISPPIATYILPKTIVAKKYRRGSKPECNFMKLNETVVWDLDINNAQELLKLTLDDAKLDNTIKTEILKINPKEEFVDIRITERVIVKTVRVLSFNSNALESSDDIYDSIQAKSLSAYCIGFDLEAGKKYQITYKYVPHPLKQQKSVVVVSEFEQIDDLNKFNLTDEIKESIKKLQFNDLPTIQDKLNKHYDQDLARVKLYNNRDLWLLTSLHFNTPLLMKYGGKQMRAFLDIIAIGESRSGKSIMAVNMVRKYNIGKIFNADGATTRALIGGTIDDESGPGVQFGSLARENYGLVVLEEVKDIANELFPSLRSIRSSNILRIQRVAGDLETPLYVRLMFLTNPKVRSGLEINMKTNFNNGLEVVSSVVAAPEDRTRFDVMFLVDHPDNLDEPTPKQFEYNYAPLIDDIHYQNVIRYIWTRQKHNIIWADGVESYIAKAGEKLSKRFNTMSNIYGTEAHIKIARLSLALACFTLSTDASLENIVVTKEHVDYMVQYLIKIYESPLFRWDLTVVNQKEKSTISDMDRVVMREVYTSNNGEMLLATLNSLPSSGIRRNELQTVCGMGSQESEYSILISQLYNNHFIEINGAVIVLTNKFKDCYLQVTKLKKTPKTVLEGLKDVLRNS